MMDIPGVDCYGRTDRTYMELYNARSPEGAIASTIHRAKIIKQSFPSEYEGVPHE